MNIFFAIYNLLTKLTLWIWALLQRPPVVGTLDTFPAFYRTRRFNTEFTRALHLFLSWARIIHSKLPHPTSPRSILILSTHLRLSLPRALAVYKAKKCITKLTSPYDWVLSLLRSILILCSSSFSLCFSGFPEMLSDTSHACSEPAHLFLLFAKLITFHEN
jgi:hypothetical protein